jgi:hypothetical protein
MHWLYISKSLALAAGLTHYGTMYGVPAWFAGDDDETLMCTPKMPILHVWCRLADYAYEVASWFMPADAVLVSPIYVQGEIV